MLKLHTWLRVNKQLVYVSDCLAVSCAGKQECNACSAWGLGNYIYLLWAFVCSAAGKKKRSWWKYARAKILQLSLHSSRSTSMERCQLGQTGAAVWWQQRCSLEGNWDLLAGLCSGGCVVTGTWVSAGVSTEGFSHTFGVQSNRLNVCEAVCASAYMWAICCRWITGGVIMKVISISGCTQTFLNLSQRYVHHICSGVY